MVVKMAIQKRTLLLSALIAAHFQAANAENFTVGVEAIDYYPLYAYKQGSYQGLAEEILSKFAQQSGHTFTYKAFPVLRLTTNFVQGKVDFRFPDNSHWAGDIKKGKDVVYSSAVINFTDGVMVKAANKGKPIENFKKLGTLRGFTPWDYLSLIKSGKVSPKESTTLKTLVLQTINGRVDGAYFNVAVASYYLKNELKQPGALTFDESLPHTSSTYSLSTIDHPGLIKQFDAFLEKESQWITETKKKYEVD